MASFFKSEIDNLIGRRATPLVRLIVINIIVFIIANIWVNIPGYSDYLYQYFALSSSPRMLLRHPWTLFTYMFLHVNTWHLVFNMLWFYMLGRIFADFMRGNKLFYTYLFGGFAGGIFFILYSNLLHENDYLLGASAGIMAVIVAAAILVPSYLIRVIFIGEVQLKYVVICAFLLFSIVDFSVNSGGKVSHIGGALYGMLYIFQVRRGKDYAQMAGNFFDKIGSLFKKKPKIRKTGGNGISQKKATIHEKQKKIDSILDKISSSGYDALSKEEKDFLFKSSKDS